MRSATVRKIRHLVICASLASFAGCDIGAAIGEGEPLAERVKFDAASGRVWQLSADGVVLYQEGQEQKTTVPLRDWIWLGAPNCVPDLAIGPAGEAVITSNVVPVLWKVDPKTLAVSVHHLVLDADADKDVGFSGIVYSEEHAAYFAVSGIQGSLWRIDRSLDKAEKILLPAPVRKACGLAMRSHDARASVGALCAAALPDNWVVSLAPDLRSGHVRRASCADRPSLPSLVVSRAR